MLIIVHVDDFLCSGTEEDCMWLYDSLHKKYDLKSALLRPGSTEEGRYLNRRIRWVGNEIEIEGDDKHTKVLLDEWGMSQCKGVDTPISKGVIEEINTGEQLNEAEARKARRAIARINFMAQDRADLAVVSRVLSQGMATPHAGICGGIKRVIRYLKQNPRCILRISIDRCRNIEAWTDSDWADDVVSRRSCSGGFVMWLGVVLAFWSKLQSNVALSSGEAELNAAVKAMSETIGVYNLVKELLGVECPITLCTDASACKGIVLRQGSGRIKHLDVKTLWVQGAVESFGVKVSKISREINPADIMTHGVSRAELARHLEAVGYSLAGWPQQCSHVPPSSAV
jgi:hypothetical protein